MLDDAIARALPGHNNPPDPIEELRAHLASTYGDLMRRCQVLLDMEARLPEQMDDEWEAKISEAIKSCTKFSRNSEVTRLEANEPHRALIAATDGFFKGMSDKVDALKAKMNKDHLTPYQQKKADAEKQRREAAAAEARRIQEEDQRRAREEATRLAEARRKEAEAKAETERTEREARETAARAEQERKDAERREQEATSRKEREAAAKEKADAEARQRAADEEARKAREDERRAADERAEQERKTKEARETAARARADTAATEKAAGAKAADMSRTRTDLGAVASLRTTWKHRVVDAGKVPRAYLSVHEPAIVAAIRAATTRDGRCDLKIDGVEIYPETGSVVR